MKVLVRFLVDIHDHILFQWLNKDKLEIPQQSLLSYFVIVDKW